MLYMLYMLYMLCVYIYIYPARPKRAYLSELILQKASLFSIFQPGIHFKEFALFQSSLFSKYALFETSLFLRIRSDEFALFPSLFSHF